MVLLKALLCAASAWQASTPQLTTPLLALLAREATLQAQLGQTFAVPVLKASTAKWRAAVPVMLAAAAQRRISPELLPVLRARPESAPTVLTTPA
jgi:hypothetical protein